MTWLLVDASFRNLSTRAFLVNSRGFRNPLANWTTSNWNHNVNFTSPTCRSRQIAASTFDSRVSRHRAIFAGSPTSNHFKAHNFTKNSVWTLKNLRAPQTCCSQKFGVFQTYEFRWLISGVLRLFKTSKLYGVCFWSTAKICSSHFLPEIF